jgi:hypothetical protein
MKIPKNEINSGIGAFCIETDVVEVETGAVWVN